VIHNWADCRAVAPAARDNPFARQHGLVDRFVVLHAGNIGLSQDLEIVLHAAGQLRDRPDIVFVFVGDGAKKRDLQDIAGRRDLRNVMFLPFQPREMMDQSYATADVSLVSLRRGLAGVIVPSKIYNVLASGRPCIAAVERDSEVADIISRHACGFVIDPGDASALRARTLDLSNDRERATAMAARARCAALHFDRPRQVAAYDALLKRGRIRLLKRAFDIALSGTGLVISAPVWLVIAAAIKMEDGGPVFFAQDRVGLGGATFRAFKFRSMVPRAATLAPHQAGECDPRITRIGRVLRATAMDELPQLFNIFRGDMSFVGPRPLMPGEIEVRGNGDLVRLDSIPGYAERHSVRPGLTGLSQVYAPRDTPRVRKFRLDSIYVRNASFRLDVFLVAVSFWITFRGRWEVRVRKF
jgi:lipopolysaccharide/colanic/teichoic acid biosynthesis glycosyltransferase